MRGGDLQVLEFIILKCEKLNDLQKNTEYFIR